MKHCDYSLGEVICEKADLLEDHAEELKALTAERDTLKAALAELVRLGRIRDKAWVGLVPSADAEYVRDRDAAWAAAFALIPEGTGEGD